MFYEENSYLMVKPLGLSLRLYVEEGHLPAARLSIGQFRGTQPLVSAVLALRVCHGIEERAAGNASSTYCFSVALAGQFFCIENSPTLTIRLILNAFASALWEQ